MTVRTLSIASFALVSLLPFISAEEMNICYDEPGIVHVGKLSMGKSYL